MEVTRIPAATSSRSIKPCAVDDPVSMPSLVQVVALCERASRLLDECSDARLTGVVEAIGRLAVTCEEYGERALWHQQGYQRSRERCECLLEDMRAMVAMLDLGGTAPPASVEIRLEDQCRQSLRDLIVLLHGSTAGAEFVDDDVGVIASAVTPIGRIATLPSGAGADTVAPAPALPERTATGEEADVTPTLEVYLLSVFQVLLDGEPVQGWPNCRGKAIFKYLITHRRRPIPKEVLMDTFWPEADPDAARNNLNVAIYGLRKILARVNPAVSYVLFQDSHYLLNPTLNIWVDAEAFMDHVQQARDRERRGELECAIQAYRAAEAIYESELLVDDRYEDWLADLRQQYQDAYLGTLERLSQHWFAFRDYDTCIGVCNKLITVDACNEAAHRQLMRCYSRLQQPHLAVRQYQYCVSALQREIQLQPQRDTVDLFDAVRSGQLI